PAGLRIAQVVDDGLRLVVVAQLVGHLGPAQARHRGLALTRGELGRGGRERVPRPAEVPGSTPNAAHVELGAPRPGRVGKSFHEGARDPGGRAGVAGRRRGAELEVQGEIPELGVGGGLGQLGRELRADALCAGLHRPGLIARSDRLVRVACGVDARLGPGAARGHHQHGNPTRRSAPHDGIPRVPRAWSAGNLTRAPLARTMRGVLAAADDTTTCIAAARAEIAAAARRVGRDPETVRIVAVTKTLPPAAVVAALAGGIDDIGENYVQEATRKRAAVDLPVTWHLIGGLQRNKVRAALRIFDWVHTVDSTDLAGALQAEAASVGRRLAVLIQVNLSVRWGS